MALASLQGPGRDDHVLAKTDALRAGEGWLAEAWLTEAQLHQRFNRSNRGLPGL